MPYVVKNTRALLDDDIDSLVDKIRANDNVDGDSNYSISRVVAGAFKPKGGWRYFAIARAMGCFVCAMFEFYFRVARKYEDGAIVKNGDVSDYE